MASPMPATSTSQALLVLNPSAHRVFPSLSRSASEATSSAPWRSILAEITSGASSRNGSAPATRATSARRNDASGQRSAPGPRTYSRRAALGRSSGPA
ncbi:hypothetical protein WME89_24085 [Sorangium sp. So ce321]|uniref:hypothetical protein n=1 Tax=Sorangium sp. So ce321 TaxID=3133300 RepID=UPI003F5ED00A